MSKMRAKMQVSNIETGEGFEQLFFSAVCKNEAYPDDGSDENNTFALFTPAAELNMFINNPDLHGEFSIGDQFYVDFTAVE